MMIELHALLRRLTRLIAMITTMAMLTLGMFVVSSSSAARADTDPPAGTPSTVSDDVLPTVQINGVVWSQVTVGDTVYAAGEFSQARPAGVAVGGPGSVNVGNLIAYNITTGNLITSFNHTLNAQALVVTKSPDNTRIYVGGDFTTVDGQARGHIAAFDVATGNLVSSFAPNLSGEVKALAATNTTAYAGGSFDYLDGVYRHHLAAMRASDGARTAWAPKTDNYSPWSMTMTPDQSKVVIGGQFHTLNSQVVDGLAAVDADSGNLVPWAASTKIPDDTSGAIMGLSTDGTNIYGSGFAFGAGASFEGEFSLNPSDGSINWVNDCQGDTYDTYPMNGALYTVSHVHNCEMIGGLTQLSDWSINQRHALAFSTASSGQKNAGPDQYGWNYSAYDHSDLLTWYPSFQWGHYTQQQQSGWSITGNGDYLSVGGEFPSVNGVAQYGLVRFAVKSKATNKMGPAACYNATAPAAKALAGGSARVSWQAATDPDNANLTYKVYRSGTAAPVYSTTQSNQYWNCPQMSFVDTGLTSGDSYTYKVTATDPFGNTYTMPLTDSVSATGGSLSAYDQGVLADGASSFWTLGESSGSTVNDFTGANDANAGSGVSRGATGPISGDSTTASTFNGNSNGSVGTNSTAPTTSALSVEAWVRTTTHSGGKIVGYGSSSSGNSSSYDRHIYMDNSGHIYFGVYPGSAKTVSSSDTYNDGDWHYVVATLDPSSGIKLYIDGAEVDADSSVTSAQSYTGYWRIGGDNLNGWPSQPSSNYFSGTIGDVAVYPSALSLSQVQAHYRAGGGSLPNQVPTAAFTSSTEDLKASFDGSGSSDPDGSVASYSWDFGDNSAAGSGAKPDHTYAAAGTYTVKLTVTDDDGATDSVSHDVTVTAPPANQVPTAAFTSSTEDLKASFDGSGSSDPDGSVASYSWDFGDNSAAGSGAKPDHTYAAAGTYTVKLTVTDDDGATDSVSHDVTVTAPSATVLASDDFQRTVATGWGSLDHGGSWSGGSSGLSVNGTRALATFSKAATSVDARVTGGSTTQSDVQVEISTDSVQPAGSLYVYVVGRRVAGGDYRAKIRLANDGTVSLAVSRMDGNTEVATVPLQLVQGVTYAAGTALHVRFEATGTSPTTLRAKVWADGTQEPSGWQVQATDDTAALQAAGNAGLAAYLSGNATGLPLTLSFDNFRLYDASTLGTQAAMAAPTGTTKKAAAAKQTVGKVQHLTKVTKANAKRLQALSKWGKP